jgi:seryl-tRNA synthetase
MFKKRNNFGIKHYSSDIFLINARKWGFHLDLDYLALSHPKGFNVKLQSGEELWSGCSGVGLERWDAVFLAQKGLDPANWPEEFKKRVDEMPKGIHFL